MPYGLNEARSVPLTGTISGLAVAIGSVGFEAESEARANYSSGKPGDAHLF